MKLPASAMTTPTTSTTPNRVKTRFLIISDTHTRTPLDNIADDEAAFRPPLPPADVLLHCGDLTMIGHLDEYEKTLDMLESIDAGLKLVIAGNHDITLDEEYYARKGEYMHRGDRYDKDLPAKAREMWKGERARKAGVTYLEEGTHTFQLQNGANLRVCTLLDSRQFHLKLTTPGLRVPLPTRILRLCLPLLPQRRPLQPSPSMHTKRQTHRREPRPRLSQYRYHDDPRTAHGRHGRDNIRTARRLRPPTARCSTLQTPASLLWAYT